MPAQEETQEVAEEMNDVMTHYRKIAAAQGLSPSSTMADETIREMETDAILSIIDHPRSLILDVGCGNGYTLSVLRQKYPDVLLVGMDACPESCGRLCAAENSDATQR